MKFDVSNTWKDKAVCVKGKNDNYYVINANSDKYGKYYYTIYESDNRGVIKNIDKAEVKRATQGFDKNYFNKLVSDYEYIPKKKKTKKVKKKKSKSKTNSKKTKTSSTKSKKSKKTEEDKSIKK